jgi:hypothetical protein
MYKILLAAGLRETDMSIEIKKEKKPRLADRAETFIRENEKMRKQ